MSAIFDYFNEIKFSSNNCSESSNTSLYTLQKPLIQSRNFILKECFFSQKKEIFKREAQHKNSLSTQNSEQSQIIYSQIQQSEAENDLSLIFSEKQDDLIFQENKDENCEYKKNKHLNQNIENHQLQKFLGNSNANFIISHVQSQSGCRYYQIKVIEDPEFANNILFPILKKKIVETINDQFGNYLYQELLKVLNKDNFRYLIHHISENYREIFFSRFGTRVAQKVLEYINFDDTFGTKIYKLISSKIKNNVKYMSNDENASHIIQKFISLVKFPENNFVYEEVYESFLSISSTKFGCCTIQKCLAFGNESQKSYLTDIILNNSFFLISNQFGNYVYQWLILCSDDWIVLNAYKILSKNIISFSKEKYSSNVIEKFFEIENKSLINSFAEYILSNELNVYELVCSQYGNYIIQKMLTKVTNESLVNKILSIIGQNIHKIKRTTFGKKLLVKLLKNYSILSTFVNNI